MSPLGSRIPSFAVSLAALVLALAAGAASLVRGDAGLPSPRPADAPATVFSAARAHEHLAALAREPRPAGSAAHDRARDLLLARLAALGVEVTRDRALSTATWFTNFHLAGTVDNIVARIPGTRPGGAVLFVGHYDSVENGPGAADDAAAPAAFLEVIANLNAGPRPRNDVVFLFADAEESGLLGARRFIAASPLMKNVRAVFNFDARGTRGPFLLFETGPRSGGLVREYRRAVEVPRGNSLANAVFPLLVNDTDFSPFRAAGVPGLNFALIEGLERYHTATDALPHLDQRSLQHLGDQVLSLARRFGECDLAAVTGAGEGELVFTNIAGDGLIAYPVWAARAVAAASVLILVAIVIAGLRRGRVTPRGLLAGAGLCLARCLAAAAAAAGFRALTALIIPGYRFMTLGEPYDAAPYRIAVTALAVLAVALPLAHRRFREGLAARGLGVLAVWAALCLAAAFFLPGASYLFQLPLIAGLLVAPFLFLSPGPAHDAGVVILSLPVIVLAAPVLAWLHDALGFGGAAIAGFATALLLSLLSPLVSVVMRPWRPGLPVIAAVTCVAALIVAAATDRADATRPRQDTVAYGLDAGSGAALWFSCDPAIDEWTSQFFPEERRRALPELLPMAPTCLVTPDRPLVAPAPPIAGLTPPVLTVIDDRPVDGHRRLTVLARSARGAPSLYCFIKDGGTITDIAVDGVSIPNIDAARLKPGQRFLMQRLDYRGWRFLRVSALPAAGVRVTLTRRGHGPVEFRITDLSPGIPSVPGLRPRPSHIISSPHYFLRDATMVSRPYRFPDTHAPGVRP